MKYWQRFKVFIRMGLCLLGISCFNQGITQVQTARYISMISNSHGFYEYLPQGYNPTGTQTYPLLIFIHGLGELGDGSSGQLPKVLNAGPPKLINQGIFPTSFLVNGQTFRYIVISPQFVAWPTPADINGIINYIIQHYKVNINKVYLTGLSMGGALVWEYPGNNSTYANRITAIVPICGASWPDHARARTIATANIAVWATQNDGDPSLPVSYTLDYVSQINEPPAPVPPAKATIFHAASHDAWTKTYDLNFRENGLNVFEWMLQFQRGTAPAPNIIPTANAGTDKTITLPTNSVTLSGTGSDPDGTISTYSWSKIAGPSQFTISNSSIAAPLISNLVAGTYTFRLTVKDNAGASDIDDMNVIVNPAPPPVTGTQRILIDVGNVSTTSPDQWGKYWNNMTSAQPGIRVSNAKASTNTATTIGLEVVNRIDGTFGTSGSGLNTGNTTGVVGDYPANATTDFAFAHNSTTSGKWRIFGLNTQKLYSIKFWGTKSATADYTIQIKRSDQTTWQEYNASNNTNFNTAALFTFNGKSEMSFDIRTKSGSSGFGYINLVDIIESSNQPPTANAGADKTITLPTNSVTLSGSGSDPDGTISTYKWSKTAGPSQFTISNSTIASPVISNLVAGTYTFRLTVTDNAGASAFDDMNIIVNAAPVSNTQRVLIDPGSVTTASPDQWGKYWNTMTSAQPGIRVSDAKTTTNTATTIGLEVINRIDGTFGTSGSGLNTGNTIGVVGDYPANATTDFAFAHSSTTTGKWRIFGLSALKQYTVKFWGTKSATGDYTIQIKRSDQTTWQQYNASNNTNFNTAGLFTFSGLTEMSFDIKTKSGSDGFGYINVIDIQSTDQAGSVSQQSAAVDEVTTNSVSSIYPNPVKDQFVLQVNNSNTGAMNVRIIDLKGSVAKEINFTKTHAGSTQVYLSAKGLPPGSYFIRIQIAKWTQSIQMIKQ